MLYLSTSTQNKRSVLFHSKLSWRFSHVDDVEAAEGLWQTRDDGAVPLGVIVELEQRRGHQLVVAGHREIRLLLQLHREQLPVNHFLEAPQTFPYANGR